MVSENTAGAASREGRLRPTPSLALTVAIPLLYLAVFGAFLFRTGDTDWDQILSFHELSLWNGQLSGIAKQWNPLMRGGMSLAGDPQVPVFSLSMILSRAIHPAAAIKISCLIFLALGAIGAWLLARDLRLPPHAAALAGALYAGNGYILSRFSHGHVVFLGTLGLPLWIWAARRSVRASGEAAGAANRRLLSLAIAGGIFFALSTDGAPIAILLLLVWVGLETAILSWQNRSARPLLFFAASVVFAAALDAVYFFPLVSNALLFPRVQPEAFVNPLVFFWFLLLPVRGRLIPAPANGHELSVYIGPVIAYLLVRYRREIARAFPADDRRRMLAVAAASFVLGLGAWRALADWLPPGPFDLLHRLPGFVAVGIPSRFWGYLALPFALAGAAAISRLETEPARFRRAVWAGLFVSVLGFQLLSIVPPFVTARGRVVVDVRRVPPAITEIRNVHGPHLSQADELSPDTGLIEAYNGHEFIQGRIRQGTQIVNSALSPEGSTVTVAARWEGWNRIRFEFPSGAPAGTKVALNANFHPRWTFSGGLAKRTPRGNLLAVLSGGVPAGAVLELAFRDPASDLGARVSLWSLFAMLAVGLALAVARLLEAARSRESRLALSRRS